MKFVVNGAGASGITVGTLILAYGAKNMIICDTKGAIWDGRTEGMNDAKRKVAKLTNHNKEKGTLEDVIKGADCFIGLSVAGALKKEWVKTMNKDPIIFAMANPVPEIMPDEAKEAGAFIYGSGRSDFENQINNSLVFPGIFRGLKEHHIKEITMEIKIKSSEAIAKCLEEPLSREYIIPSTLSLNIGKVISDEMAKTIKE